MNSHPSTPSWRRRALTGASIALLGAASLVTIAHAATPSTGGVGPVSGSTAAWDFAPVSASSGESGTYTASVCAPATCDSYDLTVQLPGDPASFYAQNTATLSIDYTQNDPDRSSSPTSFATA